MKTKQDVEQWMVEQLPRWEGRHKDEVFTEIYILVPEHLHGTALLYALSKGWIETL